ncbi:D-3-phosphoglycerate dehydrogenase [Galdieria sulphuraria]|uniref:2-oxoglutarate reductase n=1 Tax=Galdieria sulphuraria TaxID=130081 RepID=M2Y7F6_GALSU|nr:D-3-phosphoglycerate dehydrogenase [Galdieria sulphuraria]EME31764.1 D-3-phosphoglycerate dehydrogenase [Galdieria sulphuraria]GJD10564.1 D-3-phosphoglycerate dehydrogenase [Galdieria sulphuraria]|eukprot:XP_005708284.1 D-3-phosphoglycerate dehydrogenase [Galdieria sulphuraria]
MNSGRSSPQSRSPICSSPPKYAEMELQHLERIPPPRHPVKILLLENVHQTGVLLFEKEGFQVELLKTSLTEEELMEKIKDVHVIGIRSKTKITKRVLENASKLLAIGCFCIGTDQVDLEAAERLGIPVFNSPFANTRSVAELIIAEIVCLSRKLFDVSKGCHEGQWFKSAVGCHEIRGKTLGIVGYGHIGSQLSVLAESQGMNVIFYDIIPVLPLGNSTPCKSLEEVLSNSDFVTLHVPKSPQTENMIGEKQIKLMKKGAYLLNASRGTVVDLKALADSLRSGHLGGAAIDVYPKEPKANGSGFETPLQNCPNTILTPHIGGSTEEAQQMIGEEVATALIKLVRSGSTVNAVNFPNLEVPFTSSSHRILNVHRNVPGVLRDINNIFASRDTNVKAQVLGTTADIGYLIVDVDKETSEEVKEAIASLKPSLRTRILY